MWDLIILIPDHCLSIYFTRVSVCPIHLIQQKVMEMPPGQSDYPRTPQDTPGHPRTLHDRIFCMFSILYERVDDGLVLVCWCIN